MTMQNAPTCELCGEPMPSGEDMFKYHGYSGPCPKPPLSKQNLAEDWRDKWRNDKGVWEQERASLTADLAQAQQQRDEAQRLGALAMKARDQYDEERRESYQRMCGWKGRAELAEAQLTAAEQARDEARKDADAERTKRIVAENARTLSLLGRSSEQELREDNLRIALAEAQVAAESAARTALLEAAEEKPLQEIVDALTKIVDWESVGAAELFSEAAYTIIESWLTTRAGGGKA